MTIPSVSSNALGYGAFLGLYANMRYQLLNGIDRTMLNHFDVLGVAIFFSTALRYSYLADALSSLIVLVLCFILIIPLQLTNVCLHIT